MLSNFKIRTKILIFTLISGLMMILLAGIAVYNEFVINGKEISTLEQSIRKDNDNNIKNQVHNVITLLDGINKKYEAGMLTLEQAKKLSADLIRDLRYSADGYFWVDTIDGTNVVLLGSNTEGTNRYNLKDSHGNLIIQKIIQEAKKQDGGYSNYYFPKAGQTKPLLKRTYSKLFKPFNWVIGTGNYTDDIDKVIAENKAVQYKELSKNIAVFIIVFVLFGTVSIAITVVISKNITVPLEAAVNHAKQISKGDLTAVEAESYKQRKDEIGDLSNSLEKMQNFLKISLENLEEKAKTIQKEKEFMRTTLVSVGDGVISTNENGNVILINSAAERMLGWSKEEAYGRPFEEIFQIFNDETIEEISSPVKEVFEQGRIIENRDNIILRLKQGNEIPIESSAAPIKDMHGNITGVVLVFTDITEKKKKQKNIEYLSFHDQLTGLYNRRFLEEEMLRLDTERNYPLSLVMADINCLKLTNDAFGHLVGDELIQRLAQVLKVQCREEDIIARIGGDEFVILLPKTDLKDAEILIERIKNAISLEKIGPLSLSVSFGCETKIKAKYIISDVFKNAEDKMYNQKLAESQKIREKVINIIIDSIYQKYDGYKEYYGKIKNICKLIGNELKLNVKDMADLEKAALLSDIGNITLDGKILLKEGSLTDSELIEVKRHAEAGYHILRSYDKMAKVSEYVLAHHERWDGTGYPRRLKGEEIPLQSRIILVADTYNSIISDKPYRKALSKAEAVKEIINNAGTQFDPQVVDAFIKVHEELD